MKQRGWLALLIAFALGMTGGLSYAWLVNPLHPTNTVPASLREDYRTEYLRLIAASYAATGDLERAHSRIASLEDTNPAATLGALAQELFAAGAPESEALAMLAASLGEHPIWSVSTSQAGGTSVIPTYSLDATAASTSPPVSPTPIYQPPPTPTSTPIPASSLALLSLEKVCDPDLAEPQIRVEVGDSDGHPLSGIEILVVWNTGQDSLFTGLKPEIGLGYADFTMEQGMIYTVQIVGSMEPVTGLSAEDCSEEGEVFPASWRLIFELPPP